MITQKSPGLQKIEFAAAVNAAREEYNEKCAVVVAAMDAKDRAWNRLCALAADWEDARKAGESL